MLQFIDMDPRILIREVEDAHPARLINVPRIIRVTDFDEEAVEAFSYHVSAAHRTGQPCIPIVIDSPGGEVYSLWAMVDILDKASLPIVTIIEGKAMSCGAALFTCGAEGMRFIGPNATLMIHDVATFSGGGKSEDIKADAKETERLNKKLYNFMEARTGRRKGSLWKMVQDRGRADWYLTPQEAVKFGLANHIKVPAFRTTVTVETTLEY